MRAVALVPDLITASRIREAASVAGADLQRIDAPAELPPAESVDLLLVDWGSRRSDWGTLLSAWGKSHHFAPRTVVFGPHTDLEAHAAARAAGLGPMWARSKLFTDLPAILSGQTPGRSSAEEQT